MLHLISIRIFNVIASDILSLIGYFKYIFCKRFGAVKLKLNIKN